MNIYEISQNLLNVILQIEDNGGELTPELEKALEVQQDTFKEKIGDYTKVIKSLNADNKEISEEIKRLQNLKKSKEKIIERLSAIVLKGIKEFGDVKKTGVKYISYSTGEVSIRKSVSVETNDDAYKAIANNIRSIIVSNQIDNQLFTVDNIDDKELLSLISKQNIFVSDKDLENSDVELSVVISVKDLINGSAYEVIRDAAKYSMNFEVTPHIDKTKIKTHLKEDGAYLPNLAILKNNESLQIK